MMKRLLLITLALFLSTLATDAFAQNRPVRELGLGQQHPLFAQQQNRLPGENQQPGRGQDPLPPLTPNQKRLIQQQNQKRLIQQQLMREMGLTPEQRSRIAEIRRSHEDEITSAGRRIRVAGRALDRAIMSPDFNEDLFNQRAEEFAAAHADRIKLQARLRAQIRAVFTTEQVIRFNELQRRLQRRLREQQQIERQTNPQQDKPESRPPNEFEDQFDLISLLLFAN